ncbi:MAG: DNA mismatch repair endonuclease MutL [Rikenellaceae bacterium]|nr:DNA mismatch repair endonuclease MutL [Rikenellaceae bacterium]
MENLIKLLPDSVANQIAAGEVVQRPASVVKELVENAVDAGATTITVNIQEGGRELIQVIDNGCGISPGDTKMAFERHATSKITRADDLYALTTFGFRGEALASIVSVSEVELRTKRETDEVGLRMYVNGGAFGETSAVNIQNGTQLLVKNLFYNVPARRKFLKSKSVETKHIVDEFQRVALCNPNIEMNLYDNDTPRYKLPAATRRQRIVGMFGKHINAQLLDLQVETSIITIEGFVGHPQGAKKSGQAEQFLFVNNRFFKSPYFHKAVMAAYEKLIQPGVYPAYFLYLQVDPSRLDINIHPTKTEIKFEDETAIWQIINAAVRESLGKMGAVPLMDFDTQEPIDIPVFRPGSEQDIKIPPVSLNPDFNPFDRENESSPAQASAAGRTSRRSGSFLQHMTYGPDGMPEGWEELSKDGYDTFDPTTTPGETFRSFILDKEEPEDTELQEFISKGFDQQAPQDESWAEQGALEIESELSSGFFSYG